MFGAIISWFMRHEPNPKVAAAEHQQAIDRVIRRHIRPAFYELLKDKHRLVRVEYRVIANAMLKANKAGVSQKEVTDALDRYFSHWSVTFEEATRVFTFTPQEKNPWGPPQKKR